MKTLIALVLFASIPAWFLQNKKKRQQFKKMYAFYRTAVGSRMSPLGATLMAYKSVRT